MAPKTLRTACIKAISDISINCFKKRKRGKEKGRVLRESLQEADLTDNAVTT